MHKYTWIPSFEIIRSYWEKYRHWSERLRFKHCSYKLMAIRQITWTLCLNLTHKFTMRINCAVIRPHIHELNYLIQQTVSFCLSVSGFKLCMSKVLPDLFLSTRAQQSLNIAYWVNEVPSQQQKAPLILNTQI